MQNPTPTDQPPAAPQPGVIAPVRAADATPSATLVYRAASAERDELKDQLETLVDQRHGMLRELEDHDVPGQATAGMQQRIGQLDQRIAELDKTIAAADVQVARAASIPGAVVIQPPPIREGPPAEVYFIGPFVLLAALLARRVWRRVWRRNVAAVAEFPRELMDRLGRLEQTGEATALEVERIGEGQRFVTRLLTERAGRALGEPVGARSREES